MITFNQARYIAQAIESALAQETDFPIELVIGDDCSTDNTKTIICEYVEKFPGRIRLLAHAKNIGMNPNLAAVLEACRGEYIAVLEGDDYWTDTRKLALQVRFLDEHPDCVSCFHNVTVVPDNPQVPVEGYHPGANGSTVLCPPDMPERFPQSEFLKRNVIPTCSVMFRRASLGILPPWFHKLSLGDHPLHILCTEHGLAAYLPGIMGAYRIHNNGVWSGTNAGSRLEKTIQMYEALEKHYAGKPQSVVCRRCRLHFLWTQARLLRGLAKYDESSAITTAYLKVAGRDPVYCLTNLSRVIRMLFFKYTKRRSGSALSTP